VIGQKTSMRSDALLAPRAPAGSGAGMVLAVKEGAGQAPRRSSWSTRSR